MSLYLLIFSAIVLTCVFLNKFSGKVGIPVLLLFLALGLLCGSRDNGFASHYGWLVGDVSTVALIFIMFYGGFGTRWKSAKPVILEAGLLATVGVALTAALVGVFCHFALGWDLRESFLMGAVISSTDAATVFSILRTKKLGLKNNTAPLIEVESGSNDPMSYMLTSVMLSLMTGSVSAGNVVWRVLSQLVFGAGGGLAIATGAVFLLRRVSFKNNGFDLLMFVSIALVSYALPDLAGGNGYLSAYIVGIVLGNADFPARKPLVSLFDPVTSLMQIIIFFLLGMLAIPGDLARALGPALAIFAFLTLAARPLAVCGVLVPFRKYPPNQLGLVSFAGLRGAASIVFAILALTSGTGTSHDIFSIVFCIVLISIALQGSLIPAVAKRTGMIDAGEDVMTTFSDFKDDAEMSLGCITITGSSKWKGLEVKDLNLPQGFLLVVIVRGDSRVIPKGDTLLAEGDRVVFCAPSYEDRITDTLIKHPLSWNSRWAGHKVKEYPDAGDSILVMIQRGEERIVPDGDTLLQEGDILVILKRGAT